VNIKNQLKGLQGHIKQGVRLAKHVIPADLRATVALLCAYKAIKDSNLFDKEWYALQAPNIASDPILHYLHSGARQGLSPNRLFDSAYYVENNPDVAWSKENPFVHFVRFGWRENRNPNAYFDIDHYLGHSPDVAASGMNPLAHYIDVGAAQGLRPSLKFNERAFNERFPLLKETGINPLAYFISVRSLEESAPRNSVNLSKSKHLKAVTKSLLTGISLQGASKLLFVSTGYLESAKPILAQKIKDLVQKFGSNNCVFIVASTRDFDKSQNIVGIRDLIPFPTLKDESDLVFHCIQLFRPRFVCDLGSPGYQQVQVKCADILSKNCLLFDARFMSHRVQDKLLQILQRENNNVTTAA
jgi:hypothetical protein